LTAAGADEAQPQAETAAAQSQIQMLRFMAKTVLSIGNSGYPRPIERRRAGG
jgi:hypothetical protein